MSKEFMNIKGITNRHASKMNSTMKKEIYWLRSEEIVQRLCEIKIVHEERCSKELIVPLINSTIDLKICILDRSMVWNEEFKESVSRYTVGINFYRWKNAWDKTKLIIHKTRDRAMPNIYVQNKFRKRNIEEDKKGFGMRNQKLIAKMDIKINGRGWSWKHINGCQIFRWEN